MGHNCKLIINGVEYDVVLHGWTATLQQSSLVPAASCEAGMVGDVAWDVMEKNLGRRDAFRCVESATGMLKREPLCEACDEFHKGILKAKFMKMLAKRKQRESFEE